MPFHMYKPIVIFGAPSQIPNGMNVMFATTWSKPRETKAKVGNQIPITLEARSRPWIPKKQAKHTSQLHPMPRRSIMWNSGVTCFFVAKEITADLNGSAEKEFPSMSPALVTLFYSNRDVRVDSVQPKMIATTNKDPAKLPTNVTAQWTNIFDQGKRRWSTATVVN